MKTVYYDTKYQVIQSFIYNIVVKKDISHDDRGILNPIFSKKNQTCNHTEYLLCPRHRKFLTLII